MKCLGFELDQGKNGKLGDDIVQDIGNSQGKAQGKRILVCKMDEQAEMAEQCAREADDLRRP